MIGNTKSRLYRFLRWTERYTKTDMVYFASSNFWLLVGRIIASGSGFLLTIAFANLLTPDAFGTYKYLVAVAGFVGAFTLNGIGAGALRAIGKGQQNVIPSLFRIAILWSMPASALALLGGGYYLFKGNGTLGWSLMVIAVVNPLISNLAISKTLFVATGDFKRATLYNTVRTTTQVAIIALALFLTDSVLVIASCFFIVSAVVGYATYWHSLRVLKIIDDPTHLPENLRYSKHMSLIGILQLATSQIDQLLLWHFATPAALAIYGIAQGPTRELRTLAESVGAIVFPKFAQKSAEHHLKHNTAGRRSFQFFFILCGIAILYILAAPFLFKLFFPQYQNAVFYSQLIAGTVVLQPRVILDMFLYAHGGIKDRYAVAVPGNVTKIILLVILVPLYGVIGAIIAMYSAELVTVSITYYRYLAFRNTHHKESSPK